MLFVKILDLTNEVHRPIINNRLRTANSGLLLWKGEGQMRKKSGFTLVELLVVIAIIAILAAFLFPVFVTARSAAFQMVVSKSVKDAQTATNLYMADHDDTFPVAMYLEPDGVRTWFGKYVGGDESFDVKGGLLSPYNKGKFGKDPTLQAQPYFGDYSGIGYNWGIIGSDFHLTQNYSTWPNCQNAARGSELDETSTTVVFATSSYYSAPWTNGDGRRYLFGFFDPPSMWNGNPNIDFRHMAKVTVDVENEKVTSSGNAIVAMADGSTKTRKEPDLTEDQFWRRKPNQ